jgi:pyruvate ferredoxin oxidoreductase beta subunit
MAVNLKQLSKKKEPLSGGHSACSACVGPIVLRQVMLAAEQPIVVGCATGCMEVCTTIYPHTAWRVPYIHNAFENVAATMSGVEAAYRALKKLGKIEKEIRFIAFAGDGGTYDIGLQALSGMLERGQRVLYVCYDNQAYMNTGIQRSGATPMGAWTTTAPVGKVSSGKAQPRKDITAIVIAHRPAYAAQASPHNYRDLMTKVQKALNANGPSFINALSTCHRGWRVAQEKSIELCQLAVETRFWPLYEWQDGKYTLNYKPKEKKPVEEWLKVQGRFKHLFSPQNRHVIDSLQTEVDKRWEELLRLEEMTGGGKKPEVEKE